LSIAITREETGFIPHLSMHYEWQKQEPHS